MATTTQTNLQQQFATLHDELNQCIIGQNYLTTRMLIALLANGHLLVEGAPGLAKTTAVKALAARLEGDFHRVQFTPDLLPADLTGTDVFRPQDGSFTFQPGPIFHNIVLADEINRAPAKVQSALLEAMGERQITVGRHTYRLPDLFLVMATQNPIEQEGTYPLPEAQLDRFFMYVHIDFPSAQDEHRILHLAREATQPTVPCTQISQASLFAARQQLLSVHLSPAMETYLIQLVTSTRKTHSLSANLSRWLQFGASPRGTIALDHAARAHAWLHQRDFVSPEDVHAVIYDVLRHRIILSFEAEAEGIRADDVLTELLTVVAVP